MARKDYCPSCKTVHTNVGASFGSPLAVNLSRAVLQPQTSLRVARDFSDLAPGDPAIAAIYHAKTPTELCQISGMLAKRGAYLAAARLYGYAIAMRTIDPSYWRSEGGFGWPLFNLRGEGSGAFYVVNEWNRQFDIPSLALASAANLEAVWSNLLEAGNQYRSRSLYGDAGDVNQTLVGNVLSQLRSAQKSGSFMARAC